MLKLENRPITWKVPQKLCFDMKCYIRAVKTDGIPVDALPQAPATCCRAQKYNFFVFVKIVGGQKTKIIFDILGLDSGWQVLGGGHQKVSRPVLPS